MEMRPFVLRAYNTVSLVLAVVLCVVLALRFAGHIANEAAKKRATRAADQWLSEIDRKDYAASWYAASRSFRRAESAEDWAKAVDHLRDPAGALYARSLKSVEFEAYSSLVPCVFEHRLLPLVCQLNEDLKRIRGFYSGYVEVEYATSFVNKASAKELVWVVPYHDGEWRVSSYRLY